MTENRWVIDSFKLQAEHDLLKGLHVSFCCQRCGGLKTFKTYNMFGFIAMKKDNLGEFRSSTFSYRKSWCNQNFLHPF